jgi:uncharacterized RDD family membrane protein YckC
MSQPAAPHRIVTPEAVALDVDVAGPGSRLLAMMLDGLIQIAILIPVFAILAAAPGSTSLVIALILGFLVIFGYFPLLEGMWHGQTPGKRAQRLRVVMADGQPASWAPILVRNLVRLVDALPGMYAVGVVSMVLTRRSQRVGDLAAGTIVVRERRVAPPQPLYLEPDSSPGPVAAATAVRLDVSRLEERDYALIRGYLERRHGLEQGARFDLAERVFRAVRPRVDGPAPAMSAERFLELVARAYRERFAAPGP